MADDGKNLMRERSKMSEIKSFLNILTDLVPLKMFRYVVINVGSKLLNLLLAEIARDTSKYRSGQHTVEGLHCPCTPRTVIQGRVPDL